MVELEIRRKWVAMRTPDPYMVGKLGSRRVDRTRARLLSSRQAATVHCRARRNIGYGTSMVAVAIDCNGVGLERCPIWDRSECVR